MKYDELKVIIYIWDFDNHPKAKIRTNLSQVVTRRSIDSPERLLLSGGSAYGDVN